MAKPRKQRKDGYFEEAGKVYPDENCQTSYTDIMEGRAHPAELVERIAELEAALRPFAEHGALLRKTDRLGAPRKQLYDLGRSVLTLGHFDAARKLILGDGNG